IRATVAGYGSRFTGGRRGTDAVRATIALALDRAGVAPGAVDLVSASASSSREADFVEAAALGGLLGPEVPVTAVKSMLGECMGAAPRGPARAGAGLVALGAGPPPPPTTPKGGDPGPPPLALVSGPLARAVRTVLVPSLDLHANSACLVLRSE